MSTFATVSLPGGAARLGIYTRDHCPPHATCRDLTGRWVVRITFSFVDGDVGLLGIIPPQNNPGVRVINDLADAVRANLPACRRLWWTYQQNNPAIQTEGACCLNNTIFQGRVVVAAAYDSATSSTRMHFSDGTAMTLVV